MRDIDEMMKALSDEILGGVELHYRGGTFSVHVGAGHAIMCVPGTIQPTAEQALHMALKRWHERTPDRPFIGGGFVLAAEAVHKGVFER